MTAIRRVFAVGLGLSIVSCKTPGDLSGTSTSSLASLAERAHNLDHFDCPATGPIKVAFFDADSTLRVSKSGSVSANTPTDVNVLPFVGKKIGELNRAGYLVAIVSNQGGVSAGEVPVETAEAALVLTTKYVSEMGGEIDYIAFAPKFDEERKPKIGMAKRLDAMLADPAKCGPRNEPGNPFQAIDVPHSFMVGDSGYKRGTDGPHPDGRPEDNFADGRPADDFSNSDRLFAKNLFAPTGELTAEHFQEPTDFFGWRAFGVYNIESQGQLEDFVLSIEARSRVLAKQGAAPESQALAAEAEGLRKINGLKRAIRFVHYNIKELTSPKLNNSADVQVNRAASIIDSLNPDLLSINEMQYDIKDVPTVGTPGTGTGAPGTAQNLRLLLRRAGVDNADSWAVNLEPANTGKRARKMADGNYPTDPNSPAARELADQVSFGTFPGQYSTGFATHFPVKEQHVYTDLKWSDWAAFTPASFQLPNGQPPPADMELFDKNFNDSVVDLDGRLLHAVTFHTVPAFGFGGSDAFNIARNHEQLAFLEWYLLGSCDPAATESRVRSCQTEIRPLGGTEPFIAIGDLNVDWQSTSPGAGVLKRILKDPRVNDWRAENLDHHFRLDPEDKRSRISFLSGGGDERGDFDLGKLESELDYWLVSKHFRIEYGRVSAPPSFFKEHSCHATKGPAEAARAALTLDPARYAVTVSTRYSDSGARQFCVVSATKEFQEFRKGSDHLPTYVTVSWAKED